MTSSTETVVGSKAPTFSLPDQDGNNVSLDQYRGQYVVLYFYPKDDTPGCTKQAQGFRDANAEIQAAGAAVIGVSILDSKSKKKFAEKHDLNFTLLADEDSKVCEMYGVWKEKSMYGKKFMGIDRQTFLIDPDGNVVEHWPKAKGSEDHASEVLESIRMHKG